MIDLRQNGGGLLDEAVLVSSVFVPERRDRLDQGAASEPQRVLKATGGAIERKPVVVLVDRGTASASEIVTAALHERLGAKVVGRRTFGKGVFGQVFDLPNGGALDLTLGQLLHAEGPQPRRQGDPPGRARRRQPRHRRGRGARARARGARRPRPAGRPSG